MIVWGGVDLDQGDQNTGGRYDPGTDNWTPLARLMRPSGASSHTAVWTGTEMIVWGGTGVLEISIPVEDTILASDSWMATSTTNAPSARKSHTAVWTGGEMIVWGGADNFSDVLNSGGKYNPATNTWLPTSTTNAPDPRGRAHGSLDGQ